MIRYKKVKLLGKGSFGSATLATELASGKKVVLKEISLARLSIAEKKAAKQEAEVRYHDGLPVTAALCAFVGRLPHRSCILWDLAIACT